MNESTRTPAASPAKRTASAAWAALFCALVLGAAGYMRLVEPRMHAPPDEDESMTLAYYTWVGTDSEGFPRRVDLKNPPRPTMRNLAIGMFCSLGRWPEPNNHIVNSFLVNFSYAAVGDKLLALRLPALIGALVFAGAMSGLVLSRLRWAAAAPALALAAFAIPYVHFYSQQSRGYSWMLALQALLLGALCRLGRRPRSAFWGVVCAALSVMTFMNIVSMALDWLAPVYGLFLLLPGLLLDASSGRDEARALRKNLLLQALAIGATGAVFFMDRLPFVISSMRQYGDEWTTWRDFAVLSGDIFAYLFPSVAWSVVGVCGLAGAVLAWRDRAARPLLAACALSVAVSFAHFLAARRFPYVRVTGFFLPLVLLGLAGLMTAGLRRLARLGSAAVVSGSAACLAAVVACTFSWSYQPPSTAQRDRLAGLLEPAAAPRDASVCQILGLHLPVRPPGWSHPLSKRINRLAGPLYLGVVSEVDGSAPAYWGDGEPGRNLHRRPRWGGFDWPALVRDQTLGDYRAALLAGQASRVPAEGLDHGSHAVFFWYLDAESVAISPENFHVLMDAHEIRYHVFKRRLYVKMLVFKRVYLAVIFSSSSEEFQRVMAAFRGGQEPFGEDLWVFLPPAQASAPASRPAESSPRGRER